QRRELRLAVEAVARLGLERGRARAKHPLAVPSDRRGEARGPGGTRCPHRRQDPAAGRVQLLVRGARGAKRELLDAVAREARVRVAIDEAGDRAEAAPVDLLEVALERR